MDTGFVVKRTFLDFVGLKSDDEECAAAAPGRRRSHSDSVVDWSAAESDFGTPSKLKSAADWATGSTTEGSQPGTPRDFSSSGEEVCHARSRLNVEPVAPSGFVFGAMQVPNQSHKQLSSDSPPFFPQASHQQTPMPTMGCPGTMPMYFVTMNPDGTQVLMPVAATGMQAWGTPMMMASQAAPALPKAAVGTPVKLGALLPDDGDSGNLEKRAATLSAYAAEVRAEARRAKAAAAAMRRKECSETPVQRRSPTEATPELKRIVETETCEETKQEFDDRSDFEGDDRTTLMFRNLPNNYTRSSLLAMLDSEGFHGDYSFVYLPTDFKNFAGFGYAFVNFAKHEAAKRAKMHFRGYAKWTVPSRKVCDVVWSGPVQGLPAHTERYRNSPVMHDSVPDEYKPVVFVNGKRVAFPPPTRRIRAPRVRQGIAVEPDSPECRDRTQGDMPWVKWS